MAHKAGQIETPLLCSLTASEQFVLTAARLWVMPYRDSNQSGPEWRDGFAAAGLDEMASMSFDLLMRSIAATRCTNLDIRWPCCLRLGGDEVCLIDCLGLLQHDRKREAALRLAVWLSPAATRLAYAPADRLAGLLGAVGLALPLRSGAAGAYGTALEGYRHLDPGALRVH